MEQNPLPFVPIQDLAARHYGLTEHIAGAYLEAARVCLDRHHESPAEIKISKEFEDKAALIRWEPADERTRGALANRIDTTENGACGCILAAVELSEGLYAIGRADILTGADYYVAPAGKRLEDLEDVWRLEISGTDKGSNSAVSRLLRRKVQQTKDGASNLPAIAGVMGFEALSILIEYVNEK